MKIIICLGINQIHIYKLGDHAFLGRFHNYLLSNYENNTNRILWLKELLNAVKMLAAIFCI